MGESSSESEWPDWPKNRIRVSWSEWLIFLEKVVALLVPAFLDKESVFF